MSPRVDDRPAVRAPAPDDLLGRLRPLLPGLRERAASAEEHRRLPDETVDEIHASGILRYFQPSRFGGAEGDPRSFYEAAMMLAGACASTGWTAGILGVHAWEIALFDDQLQHEVWDDDPGAWICSAYNPGGELVAVDGGYRLSGRWRFSSGCDHASWAIVGSYISCGDHAPPDRFHVVVPRRDFDIADVWNTMGLRATGSNDIIVDDAFVPAHRVLPMRSVHEGEVPGHAVNDGPLYRMPFGSLFVNVITAPIIGMAEAMLAEGVVRSKTRVSALGRTLTTDPYTIAHLGRAASRIEGARMQLLRNIGDLYETATLGGEITLAQRSRTRRDQVVGSDQALEALDEIFDRIGASAIHLTDPAQRIWRDAHAAQHHMANSLERPLYSWTHHAMGLGTTDIMV